MNVSGSCELLRAARFESEKSKLASSMSTSGSSPPAFANAPAREELGFVVAGSPCHLRKSDKRAAFEEAVPRVE